MQRRALGALLACVAVLFSSCSGTPDAFPAGTEFGSRLENEFNSSDPKLNLMKMTVQYPENFHGAILEANASRSDQNTLTLLLSALHQGDISYCVIADLVTIANSKGARGR